MPWSSCGIEHACLACEAIPEHTDTCVHPGPRSCMSCSAASMRVPQHISTTISSVSFLVSAWQGRQAAGFTTGVVKCTPGNLAGETCSHCTGGIQIPLYPDAQLPPLLSRRQQAAVGVLHEGVGLAAGVEGPVSLSDCHDGSDAVR